MSLLGIDVGTTGCKAVVFTAEGALLASAYREYDYRAARPGEAVLDSRAVWGKIRGAIREACGSAEEPVQALAVSSMGEAVVPVSRDRSILGPSILNFDTRGQEYLPQLRSAVSDEELFRLNGNTWGNVYGVTKLMWLREHRPALYERADRLLLWAGFVAFMLGGEPSVDYSLANRTLLFDLDAREWSDRLLSLSGLDREKLPRPVPAGTVVGRLRPELAPELNVPAGTPIVIGAHDQCSNAVGCGVTRSGSAMFGMGTYLCVLPVYTQRPAAGLMVPRGLPAEHHAVPDRFVTFIYNMSGAIVKWFRNTAAAEEHRQAQERGEDAYDRLFAELPSGPSSLTVLPHFCPMGPPEFQSDSSGVITGLTLETRRGDILKGILEGALFSMREGVELLPQVGITVESYRAAGGGSRSEHWVQLCCDILDRPFIRPRVTEAGALGAAVAAGAGTGLFDSMDQGAEAMVHLDRTFEPRPERVRLYDERYERYRRLWPLLREFLTGRP